MQFVGIAVLLLLIGVLIGFVSGAYLGKQEGMRAGKKKERKKWERFCGQCDAMIKEVLNAQDTKEG